MAPCGNDGSCPAAASFARTIRINSVTLIASCDRRFELAMRFLAASIVFLELVLSIRPSVAQPKTFSVQQWAGGVHFNAKARQFESCTASTKNQAGITIRYSVDRRFQWQLGFANPNWDFVVGHKIRVTIQTGDDNFRNLVATAMTDNSLAIEVTDPIALFDRLRTNRVMRVQAGGLNWDFSSIDSNEVMATLVSCVLQHTSRGRKPRRNTATTSGKPLQLAPSTDTRSEAKAIMANVLAQIGISGFQYVAPSNAFPVGRADTAWRKDMVSGTLAVMADRKWAQETIAHDILNGSAQPCRGHLFVIATPDTVDRVPIVRSFMSCRDVDHAISAYYVALPRNAGGYYQIATLKSGLDFGPKRIAEDLDLKIRSVIVGAIAKHGSAAEPRE